MSAILDYSFVSWLEFLIIAVVGLFTLLLADRFHLFKRHSWKTSIGYHVFFCLILSLITIAFLAIDPIFHLIVLIVLFGFLYKNVFAYARSIFNLYFSKIHIGDQIKIGDTIGVLSSINLGGMHITSNNEKTFYPFENWAGDKIVLLSEEGKVAVSLIINDDESREDHKGIYALEKSLFNFPYLADEKIFITSRKDALLVKAMLTRSDTKESLKSNIQKAGFSINEINNK